MKSKRLNSAFRLKSGIPAGCGDVGQTGHIDACSLRNGRTTFLQHSVHVASELCDVVDQLFAETSPPVVHLVVRGIFFVTRFSS